MKIYLVFYAKEVMKAYEDPDDAAIHASNLRCGEYNAPVFVREMEVVPAQ